MPCLFGVALRIWRNRDESETGGPDLGPQTQQRGFENFVPVAQLLLQPFDLGLVFLSGEPRRFPSQLFHLFPGKLVTQQDQTGRIAHAGQGLAAQTDGLHPTDHHSGQFQTQQCMLLPQLPGGLVEEADLTTKREVAAQVSTRKAQRP